MTEESPTGNLGVQGLRDSHSSDYCQVRSEKKIRAASKRRFESRASRTRKLKKQSILKIFRNPLLKNSMSKYESTIDSSFHGLGFWIY